MWKIALNLFQKSLKALWLKGQFWHFEHWAPFLVCLGWDSGWHRNVDYWSGLGYSANLESPLHASEWLAMGIHKDSLKTTLNFRFLKCATHWVESGARWCSKSSILAKYSFCRILFGIFLIPLKRKPDRNRKLGCLLLVEVFTNRQNFGVTTLFHPRQTRKEC